MEKPKCPFCGSEEILIKTPYVDRITGESETTYCCKAQAQNHKYINRHTNSRTGERPSWEEVAKG